MKLNTAIKSILTLLLIPAALIGTIELGGRVFISVKYGCPINQTVSLFEADKLLGFKLKPNSRGFTISINSLGFRGPETSLDNKDGIIRIIAIGGSTTFGSENGETETYPALLESKLNEAGKNIYEVINAGVPAYYSFHQVLRLKELSGLKPDIVLIFEGWNDFWYAYSLGKEWKPNVIDRRVCGYYTSFLYNNSLTYRLIQALKRKTLYAIKRKAKPEILKMYQDAYDNKAMYDNFRSNLEELSKGFRSRNAKVFLIKYPCLLKEEMSESDKSAIRKVEPFYEEFWPFVLAQKKLLAQIDLSTQKLEVETIDLNPYFDRFRGEKRAELFSDIIHFTAKGNDLIAQALYEKLKGK